MSRHDKIYTMLLGVIAFLFITAAISLSNFATNPRYPAETQAVFRMTVRIVALYIAACIGVLLIRVFAPQHRKWPTLGLNIVLVIYFPFGTPLAIYGFWKVDKDRKKIDDIPN